MKVWNWHGSELRVLGKKILKIKIRGEWRIWRFLGMTVWREKTPLSLLLNRFRTSRDFDTRNLDAELASLVALPETDGEPVLPDSIVYLATELYDTGGHTKWLRDLQMLLSGNYRQTLFLTNRSASLANAPEVLRGLRKIAAIEGTEPDWLHFERTVQEMFLRIMACRPAVLFAFIHPDDVFGAAALSLVARDGRCRILFADHASHYPLLGVSFADLVLEALPTSASLTWHRRKIRKTYICRSLMLNGVSGRTCSLDPKERVALRRRMGVGEDELCTMSGAASYKFFDATGSEYFRMIRELLESLPHVRHVLISRLSRADLAALEAEFAGSEAFSRLVILPFTREYERLFCCADVFIDSFPVSSALTFVELMRLGVPGVVKINRRSAHCSFHEYQPPDYEYMFETSREMLDGIKRLLADGEERDRIVRKNRDFYCRTYSPSAAERVYRNLLANSHDLRRFYTPPPPEGAYRFEEI